MRKFPERPFLTKDFSPAGGGIDFLGLRWVNLEMVANGLIPEINNVTQDLGTFCLAAWIPWKFRRICKSPKDCTEGNYRVFREKVEVAISSQFQNGVDSAQRGGQTRNRVGATQKLEYPSELTFAKANRTRGNSLYAAALYGPAIRALGLITSYHIFAVDRTTLRIAQVSDDVDTQTIVTTVDTALQQSNAYKSLSVLSSTSFKASEVESLGQNGLAPSYWRQARFKGLKKAFRRKLLPAEAEDSGYARTRTCRLMVRTLERRKGLTLDELRSVWHTGAFADGKTFDAGSDELRRHQRVWALFMARQYQRYALETFLSCFETAVDHGCRSVEDVVAHWIELDNEEPWPASFHELLGAEARAVTRSSDVMKISEAWNEQVHPGHPSYEYVPEEKYLERPCYQACLLLARWCWRMWKWEDDEGAKPCMRLGGVDRLSMSTTLHWLHSRRQARMSVFLRDVFSDLVFSQHIRVALARFDGEAQRLRVMLGDKGIEPTHGVTDLGERDIAWMPDRLGTLADLLCDVDVLVRENDCLNLGTEAKEML